MREYMKQVYILIAIIACVGLISNAGAEAATELDYMSESDAETDARMEWWREARFGMFIHWGLYSELEGEWNGQTNHAEWIRHTAKIPMEEYDKLLKEFDPVDFDAEEWAAMAKQAGMKYVVITSKHHDGFCLWPSDVTEYDVESTPFKRDILAELAEACRKEGIRFCTYHSIMDWHHPDYPPRGWEKNRQDANRNFDDYVAYMKAQLKEIVENYDPAVMWFDGEWEGCWTHERGKDLYNYVRGLNPDIIINNRVDKGRRGMEGMSDGDEFAGDFGTPEQQIPAKGLAGVDWESCMTMNNHWGWNKTDENWKSAEGLVRRLVDIASKGGNYLLNIGPKPDGTFPQESIERLDEIGKWMDVNGESIYGTTASPFGKVPFGRVTAKLSENKLYLHVFDWPEAGYIDLATIGSEVKSARMLGQPWWKFSLETERMDEQTVRIYLPEEPTSPYVSVVKLKYRGDLQAEEYVHVVKAESDGSFVLAAETAESDGKAKYESDKDCIGFWTDQSTVSWKLKNPKAGKYNVVMTYACDPSSTGTDFKIVIGEKQIKGQTPATAGWSDFKTMDLGEVELPAGRPSVKIMSQNKPDYALMNRNRSRGLIFATR